MFGRMAVNGTDRNNKAFIPYEYKEVITSSDKVSFFIDSYECFGWEIDQNVAGVGNDTYIQAGAYSPHNRNTIIRMKRNRKIVNKMELTRLQRNFESCVSEIETMEKSKTSLATVYALIIGIVGTAFMAGSVFAVTAQPPHIIACIILAVPAFCGWIFPYFIYRRTVQKQTEKVTPYIEAKYDEIYELCEKGNKLLN